MGGHELIIIFCYTTYKNNFKKVMGVLQAWVTTIKLYMGFFTCRKKNWRTCNKAQSPLSKFLLLLPQNEICTVGLRSNQHPKA